MGFEELMSAIKKTRTIQDHPDWPLFAAKKFPQFISFYYTNQDGQEAYWDQARVIKLDLRKLHLIVEGAHSDPLKFEIRKVMHCKDARTGDKVQELLFELIRMWQDTYETPQAEG
jgi:hypothetical protein